MYDLRDRLRKKESDLLIRFGKIENVVGDVLKTLEANGDKVKTVLLNQDVSLSRQARSGRAKGLCAGRSVAPSLVPWLT